MKTFRRNLAILLVAAFVTVIFAACNSGGSNAPASTPAPAPAPSATESSQPVNSASADKWVPTQPIHIVGQSEAGSGPDMLVRALQPFLQQEIGTPIVVENAPGAGGAIASTQIWRANPDGYSLLSHSSPLTTVTQISRDAEFDIKSFEHIIAFDLTPYVLIVSKNSPINSVADLIEASKTQKLTNSNSGIGGAMHLQSEIMKAALGIEVAEVPFNGANPAMMAVMSGDVTMSVLAYDAVINNQDEIAILAVLNSERLDVLPDVPTMLELGFEFPELTMRRGIVAPPGTPKEVVDGLIDAFATAVKNPEFLKFVEAGGMNLDIVLGEEYKTINEEYYNVIMNYIEYLGE